MMSTDEQYGPIIESIFFAHYEQGLSEFSFEREEIGQTADKLGLERPKNPGDVIYAFRYRRELPERIRDTAPAGSDWVIQLAGRGRYLFVLAKGAIITPSDMLVETKIPDATPGIIDRYALSDEQALLAKLRYNRLVDIFAGLTCYSLQNHLRTTAPEIGQVEIDEIYVGLDKRGVHYVLPVEAKGGHDRIGIVQIDQDVAVCAAKFNQLICRPLAAQFMADDLIAMFEFELTDQGLAISSEKHYRLVRPEDLSPEELSTYQNRPL